MTLDELINALFPAGHNVRVEPADVLCGTARYDGNRTAAVIGVVNAAPLGVEGALALAGRVLDVIRDSPGRPILVLIDTQGQRMRRRDELLGLNEYLAHLTKCLVLAGRLGHPTLGILYGRAAAGAFIATGLAPDALVALPGADPMVMDLPSIARVTKLPEDKLKALAEGTPVFAPGLEHALPIGAVTEAWPENELATRLAEALGAQPGGPDRRDEVGLERRGRLKAALIAKRITREAADA